MAWYFLVKIWKPCTSVIRVCIGDCQRRHIIVEKSANLTHWDGMEIFFGIAVFAFGLIFGSFLNVCIHRIPRGESVVFPSSACPVCHKHIKGYDNIPVLSWLA